MRGFPQIWGAVERALPVVLPPVATVSEWSMFPLELHVICGEYLDDDAPHIVIRFHGREDKVKMWVEWKGKRQDPGLVPTINLWKEWVYFGSPYGFSDHEGEVFLSLLQAVRVAADFLCPEGAGERVFGIEEEAPTA